MKTVPSPSTNSLQKSVICGILLVRMMQCKALLQQIKIMNDQEDQFFVQPEIEEVHDIKNLEDSGGLPEKPLEEPKYIPLKMLEIPKPQQSQYYQPFHFQQREEEESEQEEVIKDREDDFQSPFLDHYTRQQCIYQRFHNENFNKINQQSYFSGAFLHRNIFLEDSCKDLQSIEALAGLYYQTSSNQLPQSDKNDPKFDSRFESGNLFAVFKVGQYEYDLVMSNDINSIGNNQWFYFSVENLQMDKEYIFSVVNFTKTDSLFNYGMKPAVYSMAENKHVFGVEKGWRREGKDVGYKKGVIHRENSRRKYYSLTFKISTPFQKDKLFIAHSYPYTLQQLNKFIIKKIANNKQLITRTTIGKTLSKKSQQCLTICQPLKTKKKDVRKAIIIMARQHPGQTQGSYVCEGVVEKLLNRSKESQFLIKNYVVYVVPMVNPDGVMFGHYRTNLAGKDLNRNWNINERDSSCPEVTSIKNFIQEIGKQRQIRFVIDLHGHSKKLNSFFYGNPCADNPQAVRIYPYACSKLHPGVQYLDCTFTSDEAKRKAARVYLSYLHKLVHVYTFQSSFYAYFKDGKKIEFTPKQYRQLGGALISALFLQLDHEIRFDQSFDFSTKKNPAKQYNSSPFVKMLQQLKKNKDLMDQGGAGDSGSESKPQQNEINNEELEGLKVKRPNSTPSTHEIAQANTMKISRKGIRDKRQFSFSRPIRNIKYLEVSRVNSILPDKNQMGLQPIKKKEPAESNRPVKQVVRESIQCQTEPKNQLKCVFFKNTEIQNCLLSNSIKAQPISKRRYSSMIQSQNRNIIFKFDIFGQTTTRLEQQPQKPIMTQKYAYSQTMITYSSEQGEKIKPSQVLPVVDTPEREQKKRMRNNSIRMDSSARGGMRKDAQSFFTGLVKKLITEKETLRAEQFQNKSILDKPLSIKKKEITRK